jgi:hypothetical protein
MQKALIILFILFICRFSISCCRDADYYYKWANINIQNLSYNINDTSVLLVDSIKASHYGFQSLFKHEKVAFLNMKNLGINSAFALSCHANAILKDSVISITITTKNDYNHIHFSGDDITHYFLARPVPNGFTGTDFNFKPVKDYISHLNTEDALGYNRMQFKLEDTTANLGSHVFYLNLRMKSGIVLSDSTFIRFY